MAVFSAFEANTIINATRKLVYTSGCFLSLNILRAAEFYGRIWSLLQQEASLGLLIIIYNFPVTAAMLWIFSVSFWKNF